MSLSLANPGGIILCGGHSRRMGRPKAWLDFAGETLLARVVRLLSEAASPIVVVAAAGQDVPPIGVVVTRDTTADRGPLEGIASGLEATAVPSFVTACDVPFLDPAFVRRMAAERGDADAAVPVAGGIRHTLSGVYHPRLVPLIRELLSAGETRPAALFERCRVRFVAVGDEPSLRGVNTPQEYAGALSALATPATGSGAPRPRCGGEGLG